jgi:hypothetical protein
MWGCCVLIVVLIVAGVSVALWYMLVYAKEPGVMAQRYIGSACNTLDASGCNPYQLPMYTDSSYLPTTQLLQLDHDSVQISKFTAYHSQTTVHKQQYVSAYMDTVVDSFGLRVGGLLDGICFSLGLQHKSLVTTMGQDTGRYYYSETSRDYKVFTAKYVPPANASHKLQPKFASDAKALPVNISGDANVKAWMCFFDEYGTHYVKEVDFGGVMRMRAFVDSYATTTASIDTSEWGWNLGASFNKTAGLGVSYTDAHTEQQFDSFEDCVTEKSLYAAGGHAFFASTEVHDYDAWYTTIEGNPVPIATTLGKLSEIMPSSTSDGYEEALAEYQTKCPYTVEGGVCNGFGTCSACALKSGEEGTCACDGGAYPDTNENGQTVCYPTCPGNGNCNGNGDCKKGKCECYVNADGFGHDGDDCSMPCGTHQYQMHGHCWKVNGKCVDKDDQGGTQGTCYCQDLLGFTETDQVRGNFHGSKGLPSFLGLGDSTNWACSGSEACWGGAGNCATPTEATCYFGTGKQCATAPNIGVEALKQKYGFTSPRQIELLPYNGTQNASNSPLWLVPEW